MNVIRLFMRSGMHQPDTIMPKFLTCAILGIGILDYSSLSTPGTGEKLVFQKDTKTTSTATQSWSRSAQQSRYEFGMTSPQCLNLRAKRPLD